MKNMVIELSSYLTRYIADQTPEERMNELEDRAKEIAHRKSRETKEKM